MGKRNQAGHSAKISERTARMIWILWHCTWGFPQTLVGFLLFLLLYRHPHEWYRNSIVTHWKQPGSTSLGPFLFMEEDCEKGDMLYNHEYGHSIQAAILGILYFPVIYIPSLLWFHLPCCKRLRRRKNISYYDFYPEKWANSAGSGGGESPLILRTRK